MERKDDEDGKRLFWYLHPDHTYLLVAYAKDAAECPQRFEIYDQVLPIFQDTELNNLKEERETNRGQREKRQDVSMRRKLKAIDATPELLKEVKGALRAFHVMEPRKSDGEHELQQEQRLFPVNRTDLGLKEDLISLTELNYPMVMYQLRERFYRDLLYTNVGDVLLSVNPLKPVELCTNDDYLELYKGSEKQMKASKKSEHDSLPPHIYHLASQVCQGVAHHNQSCIISGESGAGKTETTRLFLKYVTHHFHRSVADEKEKHNIAECSRNPQTKDLRGEPIGEKIFLSGRVLESFGNATTIHNDNSSRFGKFVQVIMTNAQVISVLRIKHDKVLSAGGTSCFLDQTKCSSLQNTYDIAGCQVTNYLLEKSRVIAQNEGEGNFHIFYQLTSFLKRCLCSSGSSELEVGHDSNDEKGSLQALQNYFRKVFQRYDIDANDLVCGIETNKNQFISVKKLTTANESCSDMAKFTELVETLTKIGMAGKKIETICSVVLFIILIGFVELAKDDLLLDFNPEVFKALIGIEFETIKTLFLYQTLRMRKETIVKRRTPEQVCRIRDVFIKTIYAQLFRFVNKKVNELINQDTSFDVVHMFNSEMRATNALSSTKLSSNSCSSSFRFIGVLDIFGFEHFEENHFEQFLINYCNEKLNHYFLQHLVSLELKEYERYHIVDTMEDGSGASQLSNLFKSLLPGSEDGDRENSCLAMIEGKDSSIVNLVNDSSKLASSSDEKLLQQIKSQFAKSPHVEVKHRERFSVKHYAGKVVYRVQHFLSKNNDHVDEEIQKILTEIEGEDVKEMLVTTEQAPSTGTVQQSGVSRPARRPVSKTIMTKFRSELTHLTTLFNKSVVKFVRCFKPNRMQLKDLFDEEYMLTQLKYSGVVSICTVRKFGLPRRLTLTAFHEQFWQLKFSAACSVSMPHSPAERKITEAGKQTSKLDGSSIPKEWPPQHDKVFKLINKLASKVDCKLGLRIGWCTSPKEEATEYMVFLSEVQYRRLVALKTVLVDAARLKVAKFARTVLTTTWCNRFYESNGNVKRMNQRSSQCLLADPLQTGSQEIIGKQWEALVGCVRNHSLLIERVHMKDLWQQSHCCRTAFKLLHELKTRQTRIWKLKQFSNVLFKKSQERRRRKDVLQTGLMKINLFVEAQEAKTLKRLKHLAFQRLCDHVSVFLLRERLEAICKKKLLALKALEAQASLACLLRRMEASRIRSLALSLLQHWKQVVALLAVQEPCDTSIECGTTSSISKSTASEDCSRKEVSVSIEISSESDCTSDSDSEVEVEVPHLCFPSIEAGSFSLKSSSRKHVRQLFSQVNTAESKVSDARLDTSDDSQWTTGSGWTEVSRFTQTAGSSRDRSYRAVGEQSPMLHYQAEKIAQMNLVCRKVVKLRKLELLMVSLRSYHKRLHQRAGSRNGHKVMEKLFQLQRLKLQAEVTKAEAAAGSSETTRLARTLLRAIKLNKLHEHR